MTLFNIRFLWWSKPILNLVCSHHGMRPPTVVKRLRLQPFVLRRSESLPCSITNCRSSFLFFPRSLFSSNIRGFGGFDGIMKPKDPVSGVFQGYFFFFFWLLLFHVYPSVPSPWHSYHLPSVDPRIDISYLSSRFTYQPLLEISTLALKGYLKLDIKTKLISNLHSPLWIPFLAIC